MPHENIVPNVFAFRQQVSQIYSGRIPIESNDIAKYSVKWDKIPQDQINLYLVGLDFYLE